MIELALAGWVYFEACGFELDEDLKGEYAVMIPAPNIKGFWIKKEMIMGVVEWQRSGGIDCSSLYVVTGDIPLHVIGTTEEVLEKLRE